MFSFIRQPLAYYAHIVEPQQQLLNETEPKQSCRQKKNIQQQQQQPAATPLQT